MKWRNDAWFLAKRLWSVRLALAGTVWAAAAGVWFAVPGEWHPTLSEPARWIIMALGTSLAAAQGIAVLVHQPKLDAEVQARNNDGTMPVSMPVPPSAKP